MGTSTPPLEILLVEADASEEERCASLLEAHLESRFRLVHVSSAAAARAAIARGRPDCVVLDPSLPDSDGIAFVRELAESPEGALPIVVVTAESDAELAVASIQAGAQDHAVKRRLTAEGLARSIRNAVEKIALRRQLEDKQHALQEARRRELELREELLSHVSHELRTPLTAVHQFVSILMDEVPGTLNPEQKEYLSIVYKNAVQLRDMIGDLMDVARGSAGKLLVSPTVTSLEPALDDTLRSLEGSAVEKGVELCLDPLPSLPRVLADDGRVRQVLGNLLTNAIKFTEAGRRIWVRAEVCEQDDALDGDPSVCVSVRDEGCGIPAESLGRVFERLHQEPGQVYASRRGLGLGLYICRQLIAGHGGRIWAESTPGKGSTFHFTLPVYSLRRLLRPLLLLGEEPEDGCQLVVIELGLGEELEPQEVEQGFAALHREVEGLVHRDRDVVIPRMRVVPRAGGRPRGVCFVVAHADESAARAMSSRLLRALRRSEVVRRLEAEIAIRGHPVALPPRPPEPSLGWLERVALGVRRAMDAELRSGGLLAA